MTKTTTAMNVSLTPELERFVRDKVESGKYNSASELVRESLRLLDERDQMYQIKLERLRADIQVGLDDIDAGRVVPFDAADIIKRGRERLAARKADR